MFGSLAILARALNPEPASAFESGPVTSPHLPVILEIFKQYDALALRHFGSVTPEAKADGSAVTQLDKEASAHVVAALKRHTPDFGIISEEEAQSYRPGATWKWVIDPVDGTASFARGYAVWGLGIGLMRDDVPVEGYMRFPVLGETFWYCDGAGIHNGKAMPEGAPESIADTHNVLTASTLHAILPYEKLRDFKLRSLGSSLYHLACLAAGRADAMICPTSYLWDLAAGLPFTRAAGMVEVTLDGTPDPVTGMIFDLQKLKDIINETVLEPMDHRFLNYEVPPFDKIIPTAENIAAEIWRRLEPHFTNGTRLHNVRLYETEDLWVDYSGARS